MKTVYILEYSLIDSINRIRRRSHYGVVESTDKIDKIKKQIIKAHTDYRVVFDVYASPHIFG